MEDQILFRKGIISLFNEYDFIEIIAEASNGIELFNLLPDHHPDLILLDIEMAGMDGGETLDLLHTDYPEIPVIMLTQYPEEELIANFLHRGARSYLTKNTDIEIIIETIQLVLNTPSSLKYDKCHLGIFTPREEEIIPMLCQGKTTNQIANKLNITHKTVEAHRNRIFQKSKSASIKDFLFYAYTKGIHYLKK